MNPIFKKVIFVFVFVLATLVLPAVVLLLFVDAASRFSVYVVTYGVIIFGILGYIVSSIRNMEKKIEDTMEEIKMQNAAIAYKISNSGIEIKEASEQPVTSAAHEAASSQITNVSLNPAEPLVMPAINQTPKTSDDGFDDFK